MQEKKPYEKPAVIYREKIEARAGSCSSSGGGPQKGTANCTPVVS